MYSRNEIGVNAPPTSSLSNRSKYESCDLSGSVYLIGDNGIISLPMPSQSPRDPLNWSTLKKAMAFVAMIWFAVVGLVLVQGASLMFDGLAAEFTPAQTAPYGIDILVSGPTLFMGVGTFLWIPLSLAVGRRPTFLLATLTVTFGTLWAGITNDFHQLLAAVCIIGFAEGSSTSTGILMVIDLTFIHQRPQMIAMMWGFVGFLTLSVFSLVPLMSGDGIDRHLFYLGWLIPCIISIILAYFLFPETYFVRPAVAFNGRILYQSSTEKTQIYDHWDEVPDGKQLPEVPERRLWFFMREEYSIFSMTPGGWEACLKCYPQIILCLLNPLIFWVALLEALVFGGMLAIGATYPMILSSPPYNLRPTIIALVNLAGAFGSLLAWPTSGWLISHVTTKLAMRNKGVREAEHYLPAFILPVFFAAASLFLYGITVNYGLPAPLVYLSYFFNSFAFTALATANTLWVTEAFPRWAAPAIVVVNGISYIASFGTSFAIFPWIKSHGFLEMQCELGAAIVLVGCVGLTWVFWGKKLRGVVEGRWAASEAGALRPR